MNRTKIVRSAKSSKYNFTPIANHLINNPSIGLDTIGLICYLVSLPEDWIIYKENIAKTMAQRGHGEHKFNRIWKEAKDNGYIIQKKFRRDDGKYDYSYTVSDNILTTSELSTPGKTTSGLTTSGLSTSGKPPSIQKNNKQKNNKQNNIIKKETVTNSNPIVTEEIFNATFNEFF